MVYVGIRNNGIENRHQVLCNVAKIIYRKFAMIRTAYGDDALSHTTVRTRFKWFKEGRDSIEDKIACEDNADCFLRLKRAHTSGVKNIDTYRKILNKSGEYFV